MGKIPTRDEAMEMFLEYNSGESLLRHALCVEAAMRHYAQLYGEDAEKWGVVGLLHDLDYEKFPEQHCQKTQEILTQRGVDQEIVRAVMSHGYGMCTTVEPESLMEKVLYTVDELTGLVFAAALLRPDKLEGLGVKSVMKKYRSSNFAAGVDRAVIEGGCAMWDAKLEEVVENVILAMQKRRDLIFATECP